MRKRIQKTTIRSFLLLFAFFCCGWAPVALAKEDSQKANLIKDASLSIKAGFEHISFLKERDLGLKNEQETLDFEIAYEFDNQKNLKIVLNPRLRIDFLNSNHNRYQPHQAYFLYYQPQFEIAAGLMKKAWGKAQSYNPTDVINRLDFGYDFYQPEKLSDPMVSFKWIFKPTKTFSNLSLEVLFLPLLLDTPLPDLSSRFAMKGSLDGVSYVALDEQDQPDYLESIGVGLNFNASFHQTDVGLMFYHGPEREPGFVGLLNNRLQVTPRPFTYLIDMAGVNVESIVGRFILRMEAALILTEINSPRNHQVILVEGDAIPQSYFQFVPGVEYRLENLFGGQTSLTFALEYLGENKHEDSIGEIRAFRNDLFFGVRYDLNNTLFTTFQVGLIKDLSHAEMILLAQFETKVFSWLKADVSAVIVNQDQNRLAPLSYFPNNTMVKAGFTYLWPN